jgi:hypothetical protein
VSDPVLVCPGHVLCGKCGHALKWEDMKRGATSAAGCCVHHDCEMKDIPLVFPLEVRELERAVPCGCVEVEAGGCVGYDRSKCEVHGAMYADVHC